MERKPTEKGPLGRQTQGPCVRRARQEHGWSQAELARRVGVSTKTVKRWEGNQAAPHPYASQKLCRVLGKGREELALGTLGEASLDEAIVQAPSESLYPYAVAPSVTAPGNLSTPSAPWQNDRMPVLQASAQQSMNIVAPPRRGPSAVRKALLAIIVLLIILAGTGLLLYRGLASGQHGRSLTGVEATATARSAIATAQGNATATAYAAPTATAITTNPYPSYMSGHGTLALYDPLKELSPKWDTGVDYDWGGSCDFVNGTFQVSQEKGHRSFQCNLATHYTNFAVEVQMTILRGDCGGIIFRTNDTYSNFYLFQVCSDGSYDLYIYGENTFPSSTLARNTSSAIRTGPNQLNTIGVVADGSTIDLYANQTKLTTITDSTYASGEIGLVAADIANVTLVNYNNFKVWTLVRKGRREPSQSVKG
jgi:transcriptional regulator with XRE-family HTH domain